MKTPPRPAFPLNPSSFLSLPFSLIRAASSRSRRLERRKWRWRRRHGPSRRRARAARAARGTVEESHGGALCRPSPRGGVARPSSRTPVKTNAAVFFPHGGDAGGGMKAQVGPCVRSHLCWDLGILGLGFGEILNRFESPSSLFFFLFLSPRSGRGFRVRIKWS